VGKEGVRAAGRLNRDGRPETAAGGRGKGGDVEGFRLKGGTAGRPSVSNNGDGNAAYIRFTSLIEGEKPSRPC